MEEIDADSKSKRRFYAYRVKPHPRIRKTVKWGGLVVTVLLVVVWVGSGWVNVQWNNGDGGANLLDVGRLHHFDIDPSSEQCRQRGWLVSVHNFTLSQEYYEDPPSFAGYNSFRIAPLVAVCAAVSIAAWSADLLARRRAFLNLCSTCRYDRAGLPSGAVCPECGAPAARVKT